VEARRLLRRDLLGAHRREADLVGQEELGEREAAGDDHDHHRAGAGREQDADERDVEQAQQEDREEHPELESGVAS
jgi:hypothetical protein